MLGNPFMERTVCDEIGVPAGANLDQRRTDVCERRRQICAISCDLESRHAKRVGNSREINSVRSAVDRLERRLIDDHSLRQMVEDATAVVVDEDDAHIEIASGKSQKGRCIMDRSNISQHHVRQTC